LAADGSASCLSLVNSVKFARVCSSLLDICSGERSYLFIYSCVLAIVA
jgi:hypothetical protein